MKKQEFEQVGVIGVDTGLCWIGDPCYCVTPDADNHPAQTWIEFCNQLDRDRGVTEWNYKAGHKGLGISVETGYGDDEYPVYVKRNSEGYITEVKVVFIEQE